ncbi:MAG TPA: hypothetical protein VMD30_07045 [Tepidisphaeraceae bacterium]|nr:hypothetical protein [Tepidisphaeraceae bacterium]
MSRGQAHLPDPTESAGETAALGNTDEMLSKLAGEEIDKLLAEAEVERPAEAPAASAKSAESAAAVDSQLSTQIDQLLSERKPPGAAAALDAPAAPPLPPANPAEESRLKKLAEELEVDKPASPPVEEKVSDEKADDDGEEATFDLVDDHESIWLRMLEWVNKPLDDAPEWVRPVLGKLAILTLLNSLVVIGYVVIFRKHH